jgi:two-component system, response regulator YesN
MRLSGRYRYFFFTYVGFLGLTVAVAVIAYGLSYRVIRDAAVTSGRTELEFSRQILEARIDDLHTTVRHLAANSELARVAGIGRPVPYPDYYSIIRFYDSLPMFNIASTFIDDIVVYFYQPELMISTSHVAVRMPVFYEHFFQHDELSYTEWQNKLRSRAYRGALLPSVTVSSAQGSQQYVRFLDSFPLDSFRPQGLIMVYVAEDRLMSLFDAIEIGETGFVAVISSQGELIASAGNAPVVRRYVDNPLSVAQRHVVLESNSARHGVRFVVAIPTATFYARVNRVGYAFLIIIAVELLAGVALARFFAARNTVPLRGLVARLVDDHDGHDPTADEYKLIESSIEALVRDNASLRDTLERQAPLITSTFIEQLLSGKLVDPSRIALAQREAGIAFEGELFAVCLISLRDPIKAVADDARLSGQPLMQVIIDDAWRSSVRFASYSYNIEPGVAAVILNVPSISPYEYHERLTAATEELERKLRNLTPSTVLVSCSDLVSEVARTRVAYNQAKTVHDYQSIMGESGCIFYADIKWRETNRALFDLEAETALARAVIAGDRSKTEAQLETLRQEVTISAVPPHSLELVVEQLEGALLRTSSALIFSETATQERLHWFLLASHDRVVLFNRFDVLCSAFLFLCETVQDAGRSKHTRVLEEMQQYLREHATDPQLGLHVLAEAFSLSPGYVSRFFKAHAGIGMAEYLERLRIERASAMLTEGTQTVACIARGVGYTNPNTFYKAFKRIVGVTAAEYRHRPHIHQK